MTLMLSNISLYITKVSQDLNILSDVVWFFLRDKTFLEERDFCPDILKTHFRYILHF